MAVRKMRPTLVVCVCVGVLMLMPYSAMLNPAAEAEAAPGETMLRIGFLGILSTLNPFTAYRENDMFFASLLYDSLTSFDQDLSPVPNLANSCSIVPDALPYGSVWQYNLTHNATWHDGEPFTADDVVFTMDYQTGTNWYAMWAYQPYTLMINWTEKIDDFTVRIHFYNPETKEPTAIAFGESLVVPIVPKHIWQSISPAEASFSFTNSFPIGTGPFMATASTYNEFIGGVHVTLLRNPNYHWATDFGKQVHFDKIDLRYYSNDTVLKDALQNGEIDVARFNYSGYAQLEYGIRTGSIMNITTMTGLRPDGHFTDLVINMHSGGPNQARLDPWVRVALAMATNRTELVDAVYGGNAVEGSTLVSPVYPYWHLSLGPGEDFPYGPLSAAILLMLSGYSDLDSDGILEAGPDSLTVQMGWEAEGTPLSFELLVRYDRWEDRLIANALQEAYGAIGVEIVIIYVDSAVFNLVIYSYHYDMAINYWDQSPDPNRILFVESTYAIAGWSDNAYSNIEYDQNYSASVSALDTATRQTCVQNCQMINYVETPYIVLAYLNQTYVRRTDTFTGWGNWTSHPGRSLDARWSANPLFFDLLPNSAPPTSSVSGMPTYVGTSSVSVPYVASDSCSGIDFVELYYRLGTSGPFSKYSTSGNPTGHWTASPITFDSVGDGLYQYYTIATDKYGNVEAAPSSPDSSTTVDTVAPSTLHSISGTAGSNGWYVSSVNLTLIPVDTVSGVNWTEYSIDSGSPQMYSGSVTVTADGTHIVEFYSQDNSSQTEITRSVTFKIDTTVPSLTIDLVNDTKFTSDSVVVPWASSDVTSGVNRTEWSLDGGTWQLCVGDSVSLTGLKDGVHDLELKATDNAGNSITKSVSFRVNTNMFSMSGPVGPWLDIGLILVALVVIVLLVLLLMRRRRGTGPSRSEDIKQA